MKAKALDSKIQKFNESDRLYFDKRRLSNDEYHKCTKAVSSTALKDLYHNKNPQLCHAKYIKRSVKFKPTPAMIIGSATHKLVLEPRTFKKEFAVWDGARKSGAAWQDFKAESEGLQIITQLEFDEIRRIRDAVKAHPEASKLLSGGVAEQSVFWRDPETTVLCRARADYTKEVDGQKIILDLKTCLTAEPEQFTRDLIKMGYPIQEAMYKEGFEADVFGFIAVEKSNVHTVQVYWLDDIFDECGHFLYRQALQHWSECLASNNWPPYREGITKLTCPEWFQYKCLGA